MKVLLINGSPRKNGNMSLVLAEMVKIFKEEGVETELIQIGNMDIRGGLSSTFDELNKYFTICEMPVVSSQYWNSVHGGKPGEAAGDAEGPQTMRALARNMSFTIKSIALGKERYGLPEKEEPVATNFIRQ